MKVIGITGPTGAGKTTALKVLRSLGAEVVDADEVYHRLLEEGGELKTLLTEAFGEEILDEMGRIDRKKLARAVYPQRLEELNALTHPVIVTEVGRLLRQAEARSCPVLAIDAIALFESGLSHWCGEVVAVLAPKELRLRRVMARDGVDEAYARRRIEAQRPDEYFRSYSDHVLEGREGESLSEFEGRARELFQKILAPAG